MQAFGGYVYGYNNPIHFIDVAGLYPKSILIYDPNLGLYGGYHFTQSAAHLLSLVSGVNQAYIDNAVVQERAIGQYRPFYKANEGGGAITLGHNSFNANITYTENYFSDDPKSYDNHGFGQDIYRWLSISSHEVGHIPQISKEGGMTGYLIEFIKQYAQAGGHNGAPYEKEAEVGAETFRKFNQFVNTTYGKDALTGMFNSNQFQKNKVKTLDKWWSAFQENQSKQKKSATNTFINNIQNIEQGTYEWNGSSWVKK